jgi:hypothetical protein
VEPELDETQPAPSDPARTATQAGPPRAASVGLAPGVRLDHFRIEKPLGAGGMGEVYLATDLALDRPVAIKVLPSGVTSGNARDRLVREARAQARVQHPNVAHIYFIGEDRERLYFAMEFIPGETLVDRLAKGRMAPDDALDIIRAAALGLREAHRAGFMHRDVKPSNIMMDAHGVVKILDFGLAAAAPGELGDGPVAQTSLAGTPLYMAPEQAAGGAIDLRADIYALGATLYHLVSGKPPFQADTLAELLTKHRTAVRPSLRGTAPRTAAVALDALITRMMAPSPTDRFASYDELLRAIDLASTRHTRPAGFWVRSIATSVDLLVGAMFLILPQMLLHGDAQDNGLLILAAGMVVSTLAAWRWGTTAGKALFELELISTRDGKKPRIRQLLSRASILWGGAIAFDCAEVVARELASPHVVSVACNLLEGACIAFAVLNLIWASWRSPGKRTLWDRKSDTLVRYRTSPSRA